MLQNKYAFIAYRKLQLLYRNPSYVLYLLLYLYLSRAFIWKEKVNIANCSKTFYLKVNADLHKQLLLSFGTCCHKRHSSVTSYIIRLRITQVLGTINLSYPESSLSIPSEMALTTKHLRRSKNTHIRYSWNRFRKRSQVQLK